MLIKGTAQARIRTDEVRRFRCTDHLKEIVYRCIGERGKRYESADELIDALTHPPAAAEGRERSGRSKGVHLAFTGILSSDAQRGGAAPPDAPERSSTARRPRRRPSSSAAGRIRSRPPAATRGGS